MNPSRAMGSGPVAAGDSASGPTPSTAPRPAGGGLGWSLNLGSYAGISVFLHWTFALLIAWIVLLQLGAGGGAAGALSAVGFVLALFACVLLHEFGHALTARHYGVRTRDITLLPIGGLARLERMPEHPMQEFWVALAGPAVNVVIAVVLYAVLAVQGSVAELAPAGPDVLPSSFLSRLLWVNLFIAGFNLLPAFPMDGGRVLRALLSKWMGRSRATDIAANIGQGMAILFGLLGLLGNPILIFIAIFVFLGAQGEAQLVRTESALAGLTVRDGMMTRYRTLQANDSIAHAVEELLAGSQQDFPVVEDDGQVLGILRRNDLVRALREHHGNHAVREYLSADCMNVAIDTPLRRALELMREVPCATAPVVEQGRLVGLLTLENISERVMVNAALEEDGHGPRVG